MRNGRLTMEQDLLRSRKALMEIEYQLAVNKRNFERYESLSAEDLTAILSRQEYERLRDEYQYSVRRMALPNRPRPKTHCWRRARWCSSSRLWSAWNAT